MPPDLALSSTLIGSNYPCLELIFMVPKVFEPLKFNCNSDSHSYNTEFWVSSLFRFSTTMYKASSQMSRDK